MKKLLGGATLGAVLLQLLFGVLSQILFMPTPTAFAVPVTGFIQHDTTGKWLDDRTIVGSPDGRNYIQHTIDGKTSYINQDDAPDLCVATNHQASNDAKYASVNGGIVRVIRDINSANTSGHFIVLRIGIYDGNGNSLTSDQVQIQNGRLVSKNLASPAAYYGCDHSASDQTDITLTNSAFAGASYSWKDPNTIVSTDGKKTFINDGHGNFNKQGDNSTCKEHLTVGQDTTKGTHYDKINPNGFGACSWDSNHKQNIRIANNIPAGCPGSNSGTGNPGITTANDCTPGGAAGDTKSDSTTDDPCGGHINAFAYIFCPILKSIDDLIKAAFSPPGKDGGGGWAFNELTTSPLDNGAQIKAVWTVMRNLTNVFFFIIFLLAVFANTLSIDIDAYTVKKVLPRLVAAVFLVQFSYVICSLVIDITNVLATGIPSLINLNLIPGEGVTGIQRVMSSLAGIAILGGAGVAITLLSAWILLIPVALSLLIGVLSVIFTLVLRHFIINVLIVMSPLAFAAMVLPNTEKLFKLWWSNFTKILLMFPLIILLLTLASVFTLTKKGDLLALLSPIIVFFMIPATFKASGSLMAAGTSAVRGRASGLQKKATQGQYAKDLRQGVKENNLMKAQANPDKKISFGRGLAKVQAGGLGAFTRVGKRKLAAGYAGALRTQGDEHESDFIGRNLGGSDLESIALAKNGDKVAGVKVSDAARAKAIELLGRNYQFDRLSRIREAYGGGNMNVAQNRVWETGIAKEKGNLATKAPDLISGTGAYDNMSADAFANMHQSSVKRMMEHIGGLGTSVQDMRQKEAVLRSIQGAIQAPALRSKVNASMAGQVLDHAGNFAGITVTRADGTTADGADIITNGMERLPELVDDDGNTTPQASIKI
ncbi:MAG TPA: ABC transporter permease [Candidatus Nanoarchaeia archaeon]|nr:ABC transporter permease [Candidatus Nanoarchaeia archaeon]